MKRNPLRISIVITNFNTWKMVQESIATLVRHAPDGFEEVIVMDDASTEPQPPHLGGRVRVIHNPKNLGYVRSVNVGVRAARSEIILLMDSDAHILDDILPRLVEQFAKDPQLGALGVQLVDETGRSGGDVQPEPRVLYLMLGTHLTNWLWTKWKSAAADKVCVYSCFLAIRQRAFESVAGFDEAFDFLEADVDFSMRLRAAGWQVRQDRALKACHRAKGSPQNAGRRLFQLHRNQWYLLKKHGLLSHPRLVKLVLFARHLTEFIMLSLRGLLRNDQADKIAVRKQMMRAVWSGYGTEA